VGSGSISSGGGEAWSPMEKQALAPAGIVPLISGAVTGPLGITHLPRFWLKMRAHAKGMLAEGYRHGSGTDEALLTTFGVDGTAFAAYIAAEAPDEPACEAWFRAHATNLTPETVRAFNDEVTGFEMPDPRRSEWSARFGLDDGAFTHAIGLNQLDDWDLAHALLRASGAPGAMSVPAISTSAVGPLGVMHLARLWFKHRLHGVGRLPAGYRHGAGGFDEVLSEGLGFDAEAFAMFVETETPDYLTAEAWIREDATKLNANAIAALNERLRTAKMPPESLAKRRAELGAVADGLELGIPLNDLDDWAELHRQLR
jgi:Domain of unknown function (DUF5069)